MKKLLALLIFTLFFMMPTWASEAASIDTGFDHFSTGFPLENDHAQLLCDDCHYQGIFSNTPKRCISCHSQSSFVSASSKSTSHINTGDLCDDCHTANTWELVPRFDHSAVIGSCVSCHNGTIATGKHAQHLPTSNRCDDCHITNDWTTTFFDHTGIAPATCTQCHNGTKATGLPATHITTNSECDSCHSTTAWTPASFDHANSASLCSGCHDGKTATGKSSNHFVTQQQCDTCHNTRNWQSILFRHSSATYPGDHRANLGCSACHRNNSETINWRFAAYRPDCAGCHANDYEADEHKKTDSPRQYYSVSELRDCSGSCHVYSDSSMNTIVKRRNSLHRASDREFDD